MTKLDFHRFQVRHFSNNFEQSPCYCKMGATPESRSKCLKTSKIQHQAKYQRLNANTLYVAAILFSRSSLHRETLPCLPNIVTNYCPISLLCCLSKVLERLVFDKTYDFIAKSFIPTSQFGFVRNRSTLHQLLLYSEFLQNAYDNRQQVDSIYLDICKAFDKVYVFITGPPQLLMSPTTLAKQSFLPKTFARTLVSYSVLISPGHSTTIISQPRHTGNLD